MGNLDFSANADQLKELAAYMASQINVPTIGIGGGYAPIGSINFFDATTAPQDWLACDGSVYNIADYPQLADWYEAQHGSKNFYGGDGTTTFAVPDLQGEFLRGAGTNSHANQGSGANVGEHQDATEIPYLLSNKTTQKTEMGYGDTKNFDSLFAAGGVIYTTAQTYDHSAYNNGTSRPTNTSFLICVKAVVAGEVYSTEERVVGTWIDGKKIYQKIIDCGSGPNGSANKEIAHGISNLGVTINIFGIGRISDNSWIFPVPFNSPTDLTAGIAAWMNSTNLVLQSRQDRTNTQIVITIQYTKTSD